MENFESALYRILYRNYKDRWFPEKPFKASGYRCIRVNKNYLDIRIAQAAEEAFGIEGPDIVHDILDFELTIWVDPLNCSIRIESFNIRNFYTCI